MTSPLEDIVNEALAGAANATSRQVAARVLEFTDAAAATLELLRVPLRVAQLTVDTAELCLSEFRAGFEGGAADRRR